MSEAEKELLETKDALAKSIARERRLEAERDAFVASTHRLADAIDDARATTARLEKQRDEARRSVSRLRALLVSADEQIDEANYEPGDLTNIKKLKKAITAILAETKGTP